MTLVIIKYITSGSHRSFCIVLINRHGCVPADTLEQDLFTLCLQFSEFACQELALFELVLFQNVEVDCASIFLYISKNCKVKGRLLCVSQVLRLMLFS